MDPPGEELQESLDELSYAALLHPLAVVRLMQRWTARPDDPDLVPSHSAEC